MDVPLQVGAFCLLLFFLKVAFSGIDDNCRILAFPAPFFFINKRLLSHNIGIKTVAGFENCKLLCYHEHNCVSVNYEVSTKSCEFNNATHRRRDNEFVDKNGYLYHGVENACDETQCHNGGTCQYGFTVKQYQCLCPSGFSGKLCQKDINECETRKHNCDVDAYCNNTEGSFTCFCKPGYTGNGITCTDVDECVQGSHDCLQSPASCSNTAGSYNCFCNRGYIGDGKTYCKPKEFNATFTCDDSMKMFADNTRLEHDNDRTWKTPSIYQVPGETRVISIEGTDEGLQFGILGSTSNGLLTNESWKCSSVFQNGWTSPDFDDKNWPFARVVGNHGDYPWYIRNGIAMTAKWIWANNDEKTVYCRLKLQ